MHTPGSCLIGTQTCHDIKGASEEKNKMLESEGFSRNIKALPQTPPLATAAHSRHQSRHSSCTTNQQSQSRQRSDHIDQPATVVHANSKKMLALPIPIVRAVDLNTYREPGYMGINPITLRGETGMLPGSWGDGKEFVNSMPWLEPRRQPQRQVCAAHRIKERMLPPPQQVLDRTVMNMDELRTQYAQAVLDGHACAASEMEESAGPAAIQNPKVTCPAEKGDTEADGYEWEDVTDDEEVAIEGHSEPKQKRDDSGYFSGETESTPSPSQPKPTLLRRKMVRFREGVIEEQQVRSKAKLAHRSRFGRVTAGHENVQ